MNQRYCYINECTFDDEQVLFVYNRIEEKQKIVFLFHGLLENKLNTLPIAYKLAQQGFFTILVDTFGHGERNNSFDKLGYYDFGLLFRDAYDTAWNINNIIGFMKNEYAELDYLNIICAGISNGANCALIAGYLVKNVTHVISLVGSLNWEPEMIRKCYGSFRYFAKTPYNIDEESIMSDIEQYNPLVQYPKLKSLPRALFLNGLLDTTMPIESVKNSYEKLENIYRSRGQEDKITLLAYGKNGHYVSMRMISDFIEWLKRNT